MDNQPFSKAYLDQGRHLLQEGCVLSCTFSEGTYQIEVEDPAIKEQFWPFLQMDDKGHLIDAFCTCKEAETKGSCKHLAASYLRICKDGKPPLHVLFRDSFWNQLGKIGGWRHGYETSCLSGTSAGHYVIFYKRKDPLFSIKAIGSRGKKKLKELIDERIVETEETSLKFSKLPSDEIALWRAGTPSHQLQYELSFWSDLAKWFFLEQEEGKSYKVTFEGAPNELPNSLHIHFEDVECYFFLSKTTLASLVPKLATITSNLSFHELQGIVLEKIIYDAAHKKLILQKKSQDEVLDKDVSIPEIELNGWIYHPQVGFSPKEIDPLFKEGIVEGKKIETFISKHKKTLEKYLQGCSIFQEPRSCSYTLFFDENKNFHIEAYVETPGDLSHLYSHIFGTWAYVHPQGFYYLQGLLFDEKEKIVPKEEMSDFIHRHRAWLNRFDGFHIHPSSLEAHLTYTFSHDHTLTITSSSDELEEAEGVFDFGDWFYIKGQGFYAKHTLRVDKQLKEGLVVKPDKLAAFIHQYKDELQQIRGFYSPKSPLQKIGVSIQILTHGEIRVVPIYELIPEFKDKTVQVFGDILYVEGSGFSFFPSNYKILEQYAKQVIIPLSEQDHFLKHELPELQPFIVYLDPKLEVPKDIHLYVSEVDQSGDDWVVTMSLKSELGQVSAHTLWKAMQEKQKYIFSPLGMIWLDDPRISWLEKFSARQFTALGSKLKMSTLDFLKLSLNYEVETAKDSSEKTLSFLNELETLEVKENCNIDGLKTELRTYQEFGLKWLYSLYKLGLSGLLCDEMGLGKTHQAMALIAAMKNELPKEDAKFLVVCPTSVIYHWESLLKRFLPDAKVTMFYGLQRSLGDYKTSGEILLTSYGVLRSEKKLLSTMKFALAVFDEVHIAKNSSSKTHKSLRQMQSDMYLGLTGTPIENNILELRALFEVVLPGYLPSEAIFRKEFVFPIEKNQDGQKKKLLSKLIHPFILRRRKKEVLSELPEKTEEIAYCDLSPKQKELYQNIFLDSKEELLGSLQETKQPKAYIHVFALLSKLKQVCDHPALVDETIDSSNGGGKWELFTELLDEALGSGQKVVVFSQYLKMLDIIKQYLEEKKVGFAEIRGSTQDRKEQIEKFRDDPSCMVFVGSLQAAGVGIDLVAASVVIHYDRWWNPAKENQATDRVYRIGQTRGVQVFKLVVKNTIEEYIDSLIQKKLTLLGSVIGFDEFDQIKSLQREDLIYLIERINSSL